MDATGSSTMIMLIAVNLLIPLIGIIWAIMPFLMKKSEVFAVTVPETAQHDPYLKGLKRRYFWIMVLVSVVLTAVGFLVDFGSNEYAGYIYMTAGMLLVLLIGYGLMLYSRSKVRSYKKGQNWIAQQELVTAAFYEEAPKAISLMWNLLYLPVMIITLVIGFAAYVHMPDQIPMHVGLNGVVSRYAEKSPLVIWQVVFIQAIFVVIFLACHAMIKRSKKVVNPNAPASSAFAYGLFSRAWSIYLLALGLIICIAMIGLTLSYAGIVSLMQWGVFIVIAVLIAIVGAIALSVVYGQGGSRVFARMQESDTMPADDDSRWKLGTFYFNSEDPSLFLHKRFGVGWTFNFARPAVWLCIAAFIIIMVVFAVVTTVMS